MSARATQLAKELRDRIDINAHLTPGCFVLLLFSHLFLSAGNLTTSGNLSCNDKGKTLTAF